MVTFSLNIDKAQIVLDLRRYLVHNTSAGTDIVVRAGGEGSSSCRVVLWSRLANAQLLLFRNRGWVTIEPFSFPCAAIAHDS